MEAIDPKRQAESLTGAYQNVALTTVNDHVVRISIMTEPFYWHYHPNSDETFLVIEGTLILEVGEGRLELSTGQMYTVPRGVVHRTQPAGSRSVNLTIEQANTETVRLEGKTL